MSETDPLDPLLAELFRRERIPEPPESSRARVRTRLEAVVPAMDASVSLGKIPPLARAGGFGSNALALAVSTFVAGGLLGGLVVARWRSVPAPRVVYVDRPSLVPNLAPSVGEFTPGSPPLAGSASPSRTAPQSRTAPPATPHPGPVALSTSTQDTLTAERLLIDEARTKLTTGEPNAALERLQEHERRFPRGNLVEEREALAVQALVQSGQYEAARARAEELRARWPESVFLQAVDMTIQSIP